MIDISKIRDWIVNNALWVILFLSLSLRLLYLSEYNSLWWDSEVYIGMGKYLFSNGTAGIWEVFRPIITPLLLGLIWKLGLPVVFVGTVLDILFSLISILLVYKITEKILNKTAAIFSSILFAVAPLFIFYTGVLLTEPITIMFSLFGVYYFISRDEKKTQWGSLVLTGVFCALAFLSKFPAGIVLLSVLIAIFLRDNFTQLKIKLADASIVSLSFFIVVLPFLIFNSIKYSDPLLPLTTGSSIINTFTSFYGSGTLFYLTNFFFVNPLFMFTFVGIVLLFTLKLYKEEKYSVIYSAAFIYFVYFSFFVIRKESRYLTLALPFFAIVSGITIYYIFQKVKPYLKCYPYKKIIIIMIIAYTTLVSLVLPVQISDQGINGVAKFYETNNLTGPIMVSHPFLMSEVDNLMIPSTADGAFAILVYNQDKFESIAIRTCDFLCETKECETGRKDFFDLIRSENTLIYSKNFMATTPIKTQCSFNIYMPKME